MVKAWALGLDWWLLVVFLFADMVHPLIKTPSWAGTAQHYRLWGLTDSQYLPERAFIFDSVVNMMVFAFVIIFT